MQTEVMIKNVWVPVTVEYEYSKPYTYTGEYGRSHEMRDVEGFTVYSEKGKDITDKLDEKTIQELWEAA